MQKSLTNVWTFEPKPLVGNGELEYIHLRSCYVERIVHGLHFSIACSHLVRHQTTLPRQGLCAPQSICCCGLERLRITMWWLCVQHGQGALVLMAFGCSWIIEAKKPAIFLCVHVVRLLEHS